MAAQPRKVVRSYRVVFRRRWRIFRIQSWRIPLPGGIELRAIAYWLCSLAALALLARLPLLGAPVAILPASVRLLALPLAAAWALSRWELDGRSPHRALAAQAAWLLRPRCIAALRPCPRVGASVSSASTVLMAPDLRASTYPRGRIRGPAKLLLRYPVTVSLERVPRGATNRAERLAAARRWRLRAAGSSPLHVGQTLLVPAGREVRFE